MDGMNSIEWDDNLRNTFQRKLDNGTQDIYCGVDLVNS